MFMTFNGDWLSANSKKKFRYKVKDDDCQVGGMVLFLQKLPIPENLGFVGVPFFTIGYFFSFQNKNDMWGKTVFEIKTKKTNRLPIMDIGITDIGDDNQSFKVELGRVCFS